MKIFPFFKKLIIILLLICIFIIVAGFLCANSYSSFDKSGQTSCLSNYAHIEKNYYTDLTPNRETIAKINSFVDSLSPSSSGAFLKEWKVVISPDMPTALQQSATKQKILTGPDSSTDKVHVLGYSDWHLRLIFIRAQPDPNEVYKVFIHEMGHYFDYEFGTPSSTGEFRELYSLYRDSFSEFDPSAPTGYAISSTKEFFATVFKEYFLYPEHLLSEAPEAYFFIEDLYNSVSKNKNAASTVKYDLQSAIITLFGG